MLTYLQPPAFFYEKAPVWLAEKEHRKTVSTKLTTTVRCEARIMRDGTEQSKKKRKASSQSPNTKRPRTQLEVYTKKDLVHHS